jgi:hypothetical protein
MRTLFASLSANIPVALTVVILTISARGQAAAEIPGAKPIDLGAMQQVCESSAATNIDANGQFQCTACPSYTDFHGNRESFYLRAVYQGHFSTTNAEQLLLAMNGCESHASGFGGSVLLTRDGDVWKKQSYFKGDSAWKCLSFKAHDGLDRLVCFAGDSHAGNSIYWINVVSYKDNSLHAEPLLDLSGNMAGSPIARYCYDQDIGTFEKLPSGNGFRVVVTQTRGLLPPDEDACGVTDIPMEPAQTLNLSFQFDGDAFALAPESKDSLKKIEDFVPHQTK